MKSSILLVVLFFSSLCFSSEIYQQSCRLIGEDDYLQFSIEVENNLLTNGSQLHFKVTAFEDEKCTTPYLVYLQSFTIQSLSEQKIDLKTQSVSYTALSDETAEALRYVKYCDVQDWQKDQAVQVTGQKCQDYQQLSKDSLFFQIIKTVQNSIQWGETTQELNGRSPSSRPQNLDSLIYLKHP